MLAQQRSQAQEATAWLTDWELTTEVLCLQEHQLMGDKAGDAAAWPAGRGWSSVWEEAQPTEGGGTMGGLAVAVRSHWGVRAPPAARGPITVVPGRAMHVVVDSPDGDTIEVINVYAIHSLGIVGENVEVLAAIGKRVAAAEHPWAVGGDWNVAPSLAGGLRLA